MSQRAQALAEVAQVFKFEQWLRFYFATAAESAAPSPESPEAESVVIHVPEERKAEIRATHPKLAPLLDMVDGAIMNYASSCSTVCGFVSTRLDGEAFPPGMVDGILNGRDFQVEMHLFNLWVGGHEDFLDQEQHAFGQWLEMFEAWKADPKVLEYRQKLLTAKTSAATSQSVH